MIEDVLFLYYEKLDYFIELTVQHLMISCSSIFFATLLGVLIGILIHEFKALTGVTLGIVNFLYTIPSISLLGFLISFTGIGDTTAIITLTVYALLPIVRSTYVGLVEVDGVILEAAKGMGSTVTQTLFKVKLPLAMPVILAGFKNMVVMTISLAGVASFIGAGGLGQAVYSGIATNNQVMMVAGSFLIAVLALLSDAVITLIERCYKIRRRKKTLTSRTYKLTIALLSSLILIFCTGRLHSPNAHVIHIATKPMTEQFILGEMLQMLIEDQTSLEVELTKGVAGGISNIHDALIKGDIDLYPEYTSTGYFHINPDAEVIAHDELVKRLMTQYESELGLMWVGFYGFNNTYGLLVNEDIATALEIKTYSDLVEHSDQLILGAEYDFFERADTYNALLPEYDFDFKELKQMDITLKYQAFEQGEIDVVAVSTTDGLISALDGQIILDDASVFKTYEAGTVIRKETLERYPVLESVLKTLEGQITEEDMSKMNYEVEVNNRDEYDVAYEFLVAHGLLEVAYE